MFAKTHLFCGSVIARKLGQLCTIIVSLLALGTTSSQSATSTKYTILYGGVPREYLLYLPGCYADTPLPLVVAMHGNTALLASGDRMEAQSGFSNVAEQQCFIAAYPSALTGSWDNNADVGFIQAVIADIEKRYRVDSSRRFLAGHSGGARLAGKISCTWPSGIAAFAQVSYSLRFEDVSDCATAAAKPALVMHGTADTISPYDGGRNVISAPDSAAFWADKYASGSPHLSEFNLKLDTGDDMVGELSSWSAPVKFYSLTGGGHPFPSSDASRVSSTGGGPTVIEIGSETQDPAANVIWTFFRSLATGPNSGTRTGGRASLR